MLANRVAKCLDLVVNMYKITIIFLPNRSMASIRTLFSMCWMCMSCRLEIYMFVDKDQYAKKSELLLELVICSASASVDVALSVRGAEDLSRE